MTRASEGCLRCREAADCSGSSAGSLAHIQSCSICRNVIFAASSSGSVIMTSGSMRDCMRYISFSWSRKGAALGSKRDERQAPVIGRALLREITLFDQSLQIVSDVRAEIAAASGQLADARLSASPMLKNIEACTLLISRIPAFSSSCLTTSRN